MTSELNDYPVVVDLDVRWGDMDAMGHVNNTVFFRYFECARLQYGKTLSDQGGDWPEGVGPIVASTSCNFKRPLTYPDQLRVGARIVEVEEKTYIMDHAIYSEDHDAIAGDGETTIVSYDYSRAQSVALPDSIRQVIRTMENGAV